MDILIPKRVFIRQTKRLGNKREDEKKGKRRPPEGDETKCSGPARHLIKRNHRRLNTRLAEVITHEQQSGVCRVSSREVKTGPVEV